MFYLFDDDNNQTGRIVLDVLRKLGGLRTSDVSDVRHGGWERRS